MHAQKRHFKTNKQKSGISYTELHERKTRKRKKRETVVCHRRNWEHKKRAAECAKKARGEVWTWGGEADERGCVL